MKSQSNPIGVIHGRFQILHNDHVKYIMAGKALCRHLMIGITNPDPLLTRPEQSDTERSSPLANPLSYYERLLLIRAVMKKSGISFEDYAVVPFPINVPELYQYYLPADALYFLTIYDDWGRQKKRYFQSLNLKTHVLWDVPAEQKGISSTDIRDKMINAEPWEHLVPEETVGLLLQWQVPERLKRLKQKL